MTLVLSNVAGQLFSVPAFGRVRRHASVAGASQTWCRDLVPVHLPPHLTLSPAVLEEGGVCRLLPYQVTPARCATSKYWLLGWYFQTLKIPFLTTLSTSLLFSAWLPRLMQCAVLHCRPLRGTSCADLARGSPCGLASVFLWCIPIIPGTLPCVLAEGLSGLSHTLPAQPWNPPSQEPDQRILACCSGT